MRIFDTPKELRSLYKLSYLETAFITQSRNTISDILKGIDPRLILILGPCSVHNFEGSLEYGFRLQELINKYSDKIFFIQRVYVEKPRTSKGWKGYANDPDLNETFKISTALKNIRKLYLKLTEMKIPIATEILSPFLYLFYEDLISWGSIGARTVESQIHREIASGLPFPVGFKNSTSGDICPAINAIKFASISQTYLTLNSENQLIQYQSSGNLNTHLVLRGGNKGSNYDEKTLNEIHSKLIKEDLPSSLLIDCAHGNCNKKLEGQLKAVDSISELLKKSPNYLKGVMLESYLQRGSQPFNSNGNIAPDISITDPCLGFDETEKAVQQIYSSLKILQPFIK